MCNVKYKLEVLRTVNRDRKKFIKRSWELMEEIEILDYYEKLERLINDRESEAIEWRQSNKEIDGMTVSEVTFKFRQPTLEKK